VVQGRVDERCIERKQHRDSIKLSEICLAERGDSSYWHSSDSDNTRSLVIAVEVLTCRGVPPHSGAADSFSGRRCIVLVETSVQP